METEESGGGDGAETAFKTAAAFPKRANRMEPDQGLQAKGPVPQCFSSIPPAQTTR